MHSAAEEITVSPCDMTPGWGSLYHPTFRSSHSKLEAVTVFRVPGVRVGSDAVFTCPLKIWLSFPQYPDTLISGHRSLGVEIGEMHRKCIGMPRQVLP